MYQGEIMNTLLENGLVLNDNDFLKGQIVDLTAERDATQRHFDQEYDKCSIMTKVVGEYKKLRDEAVSQLGAVTDLCNQYQDDCQRACDQRDEALKKLKERN